MARKGFTLMELLVVIGIIMILMGMLFPAFNMIRREAQKTKARTLIHQVDAACDQYRNLNGSYPDSAAMSTVFGGGTPVAVASLSESQWETVAGELLVRLQSVDRDRFGTMGRLADPWKKVLRYRPVQYYKYDAAATHVVDKDPPPHPDSYQLWSTCADEVDQFGDPGSDDLVNWKQ